MLLLALLFYGAKLYGRGELSPSFLCVSETRQIEAFAALGVILHHLTQRITGYGAVWRGPVSIFADALKMYFFPSMVFNPVNAFQFLGLK